MPFFAGGKMLKIGKCTFSYGTHRYYQTKQSTKNSLLILLTPSPPDFGHPVRQYQISATLYILVMHKPVAVM